MLFCETANRFSREFSISSPLFNHGWTSESAWSQRDVAECLHTKEKESNRFPPCWSVLEPGGFWPDSLFKRGGSHEWGRWISLPASFTVGVKSFWRQMIERAFACFSTTDSARGSARQMCSCGNQMFTPEITNAKLHWGGGKLRTNRVHRDSNTSFQCENHIRKATRPFASETTSFTNAPELKEIPHNQENSAANPQLGRWQHKTIRNYRNIQLHWSELEATALNLKSTLITSSLAHRAHSLPHGPILGWWKIQIKINTCNRF